MILAKAGRTDEAVTHLERVVSAAPDSVEYQFNLAYVLATRVDYAGAIPHLEKTAELSRGKQWQNLAMLAEAYHRAGRGAEAVDTARRALAASEGNGAAVEQVNAAIRRYEGGSWAVDK